MSAGRSLFRGACCVIALAAGNPAGGEQTGQVATPRAVRIMPPAGLPCDRNHLTSYSGEVSSYRRLPERTELSIRTWSDALEPIVLSHPGADITSRYLLFGAPFAAADWARIESSPGVLRPGTRATAWVCDDGKSVVDWRPGEPAEAYR